MQELPKILPPSHYALLVGSSCLEYEQIEAIAKKRVACLIGLLDDLTLYQNNLHTEIEKTTSVFKKYRQCLRWLEEYYAQLSEEKLYAIYPNPEIEQEHNFVLFSYLRKSILQTIGNKQDPRCYIREKF